MRFQAHSNQSGFALIEVIASAAVLGLVTLAVYAGFDATQHSSGRERARAVAASLAEQDQERLRSFRPVDLATYSAAPRVIKVPPVTGVPYTVASQVDWITDTADGTVSCTSEANQEDYLRITSTVSSSIVGDQIKPVVQRSLVAPPVGAFRQGQGTLVVQITGKTAPVTGMNVTITKPGKTVVDGTNSFGCAVFRYVPIGSYTVTFDKATYVDPGGNNLISKSGTVSEGTVNLMSLKYDQAASVLTSFTTSVPATAHAVAIPPATTPLPGAVIQSRSWSVGTEHPEDPNTGGRAWPTPVTTTNSVTQTANNLYPFGSAYLVYGGACKGANPANLGAAVIPTTGISPGFAKTPGGLNPNESYPLSVRMPSLNVKVVSNTAGTTPVLNGNVVVTPQSPNCTTQPKVAMKTWGTASSTDPNRGWATKQMTLPIAANTIFDPGMPYGIYDVCADDGSKRKTVVGVLNNDAAGSIPITINLSSGTSGSKCTFP